MSKFIEIAKKHGDIKEYRKCFDTDPYLLEPEERNFYIGEKITKYGRYDIGDIVFIKNYKKNTSIENHLFVIVDDDNRGITLNYFCMIISSNLSKINYDRNILLKKDNINNLQRDSIVKTDVIYNMKYKDITFCIGKVPIELIEQYIDLYLSGKIKKGKVEVYE